MPYFDHNATTPLLPAAREAWLQAVDAAWQNPSGPYRSGARVNNLLENARARLAAMLGCAPQQVVFNSGATEGVNAVFSYCARHPDLGKLPGLLSPIEHPCVVAAGELFFAGRAQSFSVQADGRADPVSVERQLGGEAFALVSIMAANNETGVVQPWREITTICRNSGVLSLCDASQWVGKQPMEGLGAAGFVTAAAHKFGGPKGCGFLVVPKEASGFRSQVGGEQEHGFRAGTENYPAVAAMLAALEECEARLRDEEQLRARVSWRNHFEKEVLRRLPGTRIAGQGSERLWNTVFLILPDGANDRWVRKLDRAGFEVSTGSACSWGKNEPSHVLTALGFSPGESKRAIRISSGWQTTQADWLAMADALDAVAREMASHSGDAGVVQP